MTEDTLREVREIRARLAQLEDRLAASTTDPGDAPPTMSDLLRTPRRLSATRPLDQDMNAAVRRLTGYGPKETDDAA